MNTAISAPDLYAPDPYALHALHALHALTLIGSKRSPDAVKRNPGGPPITITPPDIPRDRLAAPAAPT